MALSWIAGDDILHLLHDWEKVIREDRNLVRPAFIIRNRTLEGEIKAAIIFAQTHLQWSGSQPWISDFQRELRELHTSGMNAAKIFVQRSRRIACPSEMADSTPCNKLLKINDEDPLEIFGCAKCQTEWTTLRLVAVAMSDPKREVWLDAEAISKWVGISESNIRKIGKRYNINKRGKLYDMNAMREHLHADLTNDARSV